MDSRILYIGPISSLQKFEELSSEFKVFPSAAPIVFQNDLLKGFMENGAKVDVVGLPIVPAYPKSKYITIPCLEDRLECGYPCTLLPTINVPLIKQASRQRKVRRFIRNWIKENDNTHKIIIIYSVFAPVFNAVNHEKKHFDFDTVAIVTDLPKYMFSYSQYHGIKKIIRSIYSKYMEKIQGSMDKYVYLTKEMKNIVAPSKPDLVIEGIVNSPISGDTVAVKDKCFSIMYAGGLNKNYGLENLLIAFEKIEFKNIELWLYGSGDAVPMIREKQKKDNRIKFFGRVDRSVVLEKEKQASLLVNVRNPSDEYTLYSFPSKTMEYMMSGTPLLTTMLPGIPSEYYEYVYAIEDNSVESIRRGIENVYLAKAEERNIMGSKARQFVIEEKNARIQAQKIMKFINY